MRIKHALWIIGPIAALLAIGWMVFHQATLALIEGRVAETRKSQEPKYDNERLVRINALQTLDIINTTQPAYSSKIDACYVTHSDQGWVASNWYQDCYIRYVDLFPVFHNKNDIEQALKTSKDSTTLFGEPNDFEPKTCDSLYEVNVKATLLYFDTNVSKEDRGLDCRIPNTIQDTFTVQGPILLDNEISIHTKRSFDIKNVDISKKYLIMQSDNYYYHESLGCGIGFLCPSPREKPITNF